VVLRFQNHLFRLFRIHRIHECIDHFIQALPLLSPRNQPIWWGFIYRDVIVCVKTADRNCRHLFLGAHGFTDEWKDLLHQLDFWKL
jgi:hypothetical protein